MNRNSLALKLTLILAFVTVLMLHSANKKLTTIQHLIEFKIQQDTFKQEENF